MNKLLLALFVSFFFLSAQAQVPQISYDTPVTLYVGKTADPIKIKNTGGPVVSKLSPWMEVYRNDNSFYDAVKFVKSSTGDIYYLNNSQVIKLDTHGVRTTLASGLDLSNIAVDKSENIYLSCGNPQDEANASIKKINSQGVITTLVSGLHRPDKLVVADDGTIYFLELPGRIMRLDKNGTVSLLAGKLISGADNGVGANASFSYISDMVIDSNGNLFVSDNFNSLIRKITPQGLVTTFAGSGNGNVDGVGSQAKFFEPSTLAIDSKGYLWVFDNSNYSIRKISSNGTVVTVASTSKLYDSKSQLTGNYIGYNFIMDDDDNLLSTTIGQFVKIHTEGFSITSDLPSGLRFNADGSISGTPDNTSPLTEYTVRAINTDGISVAKFKLEIVLPKEPPVITSFSPDSVAKGGSIDITGSNFLNVTSVTIGGKPSQSFYATSSTHIYASVASDAVSGSVAVTNPYGTATVSGFNLIPAPSITSVTPLTAFKGSKIIIKGANLNKVTSVSLGGYSASYKIDSPTEIEVVADQGASGNITLFSASGNAIFPGLVFINAPSVNSFTPSYAGAGSTVTISGSNFTNATDVKIGGTSVASFIVVSPSQINAVVATGTSSGTISVITPAGTGTSFSYFSFLPPPVITAVSPLKAGAGSTISISGSNLNGAQVTIGGNYASVIYGASYQIVVVSPSNGSNGDIKVTTSNGTATYPGFVFVQAPKIISFSPSTAAAGEHVIITGSNLDEVDRVSFGGIQAQFTVTSPTTIDAVVGQGSSGNVSVTSEGGTDNMMGFTHKGPQIVSFLPLTAGNGDAVTIKGSNFTGATDVTFGGVKAISFNVVSDTVITAVVGLGTSGSVAVVTPSGQSALAGFLHPGPSITSFTPYYAGNSSTAPITITGKNFTGTTSVTFGGIAAGSYTVVNSTTITATPSNAASGDISITTPSGTVKQSGFIWAASPSIASYTPTAQKSGGYITINGTGFYGVTSVKFGGVAARYFSSSPTEINAYIDNGASGDITITTAGGTVSAGGFTYTTPVLTSVSPIMAGAGDTVILTGTALDNVQTVAFGGVNAASFTILSPQKITAVLGTGASGNVTVSGNNGNSSIAGFKFVYPVTLSAINPTVGGKDTQITISGYNLNEVTDVSVAGAAAEIISKSNNSVVIKAIDNKSGIIEVKNPVSKASIDGFQWLPAPVITSVNPLMSNAKDTITITGSNFTNIDNIKFGSQVSWFTIVSPTTIKANNTGGVGDITITGKGGVATFKGYTFLPPPAISSFQKTGDGPNATITINGSNFNKVTDVRLGGVPAKSFKVEGANKITVNPGTGSSGVISVSTSDGTATYPGYLYYIPPVIKSISAYTGPVGTNLTVTGDYFNSVPEKNIVYIGKIKAKVVSASKTQLQVTVPAYAGGVLTVTDIDKNLSCYSDLAFNISRTAPGIGLTNKLELKQQIREVINPFLHFLYDDFDSDGKPDMLVSKDDSLFILQNTSDGVLSRSSFSKKIDLNVQRHVYSMTTGDVDGDGRKDILFSMANSVVVLRNTTTGNKISFELKVLDQIYKSDYSMQLRDIDMDGKPDLCMNNLYQNLIVHLNKSDGSNINFGPAIVIKSDYVYYQGMADISGDGNPDLVLAESFGSFNVYKSNNITPGILSDLNFISSSIGNSWTYSSWNLSLSDFDQDGKIDVLESQAGTSYLLANRNISTSNIPSFSGQKILNSPPAVAIVAVGDINGDGKTDLVGGGGNTLYGYINTSTTNNIQFNDPVSMIKGGALDYLADPVVADVDGDGKADLTYIERTNNIIKIYNSASFPSPQIVNISPKAAPKGAEITITGKYFDAASVVKFGSKAAKSFILVSPDTIKAIVGEGETGLVSVQNPDGTGTFDKFTLLTAPVVTAATPSLTDRGRVEIQGSGFLEINSIKINDQDANSFTVNSATSITAYFTPGVKGDLAITNPAGTAKLAITIKAKPKIYLTQQGAHTYGDSNFSIDVSSDNKSTPVILQFDKPGIATISGNIITIKKAGTIMLIASQQADELHDAADNVTQSLTINKRQLNVKAQDQGRAYGSTAALVLPLQYSGWALADNADSLNKQAIATATADIHSNAGTYVITPSGAVSDNYTFVYENATLTVTKVPLSITADDQTRAAGKPDPDLTVHYNGFVNGDDESKLATKPTVTSSANSNSPAGVYDLVPGGAVSTNYNFIYSNGKLTVLPSNTNFRVSTTNITCKGQNNGSIAIAATESHNYTATVTGNNVSISQSFTTSFSFDNLAPGAYNVCITDADLANYKQCFDLTVTEPKDLALYASVNKNTNTATLALSGGNTYNIEVNGVNYKTSSNSITIPLVNGSNRIVMSSDLICQGRLEQLIDLNPDPVAYPNPATDVLYVDLGGLTSKKLTLQIYSMTDGGLKSTTEYSNASGVIKLNVSQLPFGVYTLYLISDSKKLSYKIIKR